MGVLMGGISIRRKNLMTLYDQISHMLPFCGLRG